MSLSRPDSEYAFGDAARGSELAAGRSAQRVEPSAAVTRLRRTPAPKRVLDVAVSTLLLLVLLPFLVVLTLLIVLDSPGNPIFAQRRVGRDGRTFRFFKLRTMVPDAEQRLAEVQHLNQANGPLFKIRRDPRVTRIGHFLRRTSLDELPQLWNVLRGDMSLVGPRPPLPHEVEAYTPHQWRRLTVTPGMTGLWQVSGRSDLSFEDAIALDLTYVDTWSFWLDLSLLLKTALVVLVARGAY